jgi:hypothetical protein
LHNWTFLIRALIIEGRLDVDTKQLVNEHRLVDPVGIVALYWPEISTAIMPDLMHAASLIDSVNKTDVLRGLIEQIIRKKTIFQCRDDHVGTGGYYDEAERYMAWQWENLIYSVIKDKDFSRVLELAPGHGRNTELLRHLSREIHLVDVNQTCIDACKERFGNEKDGCRFFYYVNDGNFLPQMRDESISFVYSFDSMVHFDKLVVRDYITEFARVMKQGATGFIHHSNLGSRLPNSDWAKNHGSRSDVSAEGFKTYCESVGLKVTYQRLMGPAEGVSVQDLDCLTIFEKA